MLVLTLLSVLYASCVSAKPTLNYAIQAQLPEIARAGEQYDWALYPNTFNSTSGSLSYTTSTLPSWLNFDEPSLTFHGSPARADAGVVDITLTASEGESTAESFTILVTTNEAPAVHLGFDTQIANPDLHNFNTATSLPSNDGVLIHPYYSFSMGFQQSTFRPGYMAFDRDIYYSAHLRGTNSLPSWLNFDNNTVTFSGVAPPSGTFVIVVIGSDYWGYSGVENSFTIQVSTEYIDVPETAGLGNITTVAGSAVDFVLDLSQVDVNGNTPKMSDLEITADLTNFPWLSFDASTLALSGITPSQFINGTQEPSYIPVTISDNAAGASASTIVYVPLTIAPSLFNMISLPNATASLGQAFSYDLKPYLRNTSEVASLNITISPSSNYTEWISVDQSNFQLSGTPPNQTSALTKRFKHRGRVMYRRADEAQAFVRITAMDAATDLISTATLNLGLAGLPGAAIPSPTSSITPTNSSTSLGDGKKSGGLSSGAKIALGVVFGLVGAALLAGLILFCCIRRRKQSKNGNKEKTRKSTDSFTGIIKSPNAEKTPFRPGGFSLFGAPPNLPRSESAKLQNGELPEFNSIYIQRPSAEGDSTPVRAVVQDGAERPVQMGMLAGILRKSSYDKRNSNGSHHSVPGLEFPSPVPGEIIRQDSLLHPGEPSDFTHSFGSSSDDRASWESRETFQWSSAEGAQTTYLAANGRPLSSAPSIPRPRNDFTPRYPRNPLAASMVRPPSDTFSGHTFSEFHDHIGSQDHSADSLTHTGSGTGTTSFATHTHSHSGSGTISGITETSSSLNGAHEAATRVPAGYSHGPSALGKIIGESGHFAPVEEEEEEEGYSDESAVLALAQRHSLEQPDIHRAPRLMPSRERFAAQSPTNDQASVASHTPSQEAIAVNNDAFDDADEEGPRDRASTAYAPSDLTGLGYPAEAIIFGDRSSQAFSSDGKRVVSIRAIPAKDVVLSPPLPQFGSMAQPTNPRAYAARRPISTGSALHDGRYIAQTNETFNLHPHIDPPPQVSLSAATWSAPAPSTYRIESSDGSALPSWLHWDGKELELWGIPALGDAGQIINVKVVERIPKPKRKSYDSSQLIPEEITEREVGSCIIEVADNIKSPDTFSVEGYSSPPTTFSSAL